MLGLGTPFLPPTMHPGQSVGIPVIFFDDFVTGGQGTTVGHKFATSANSAEWLVTADNGGSNFIIDLHGGIVRVKPGTAANDFRSIQLNGQSFHTAVGRKIIFEAKIRTNNADDIRFFVGLASEDTTGTTFGPILDGTTNSIGFRNTAGNDARFQAVSENAAVETLAEAGSLADSEFAVLRFELDGTDLVRFFVNGKLVATMRENIPVAGTALTPTIEVNSPTGGTPTHIDVDYILVVAER